MLKQLGKEKTIKPWTIYLWRRGDKMEGASPVVTKDGVKQIYCFGWEIEKVPGAEKNEERHQQWRARINVKNMLNNTLNVLNWYGKKVLDSDGNISSEKLAKMEFSAAEKLVKENIKIEEMNKNRPKDAQLAGFDLDDAYKIRKFPIKDITASEAQEYGFIGNLIQNKFIDKN